MKAIWKGAGYGIAWTLFALIVLALIAFIVARVAPRSHLRPLNPESYTPAEARLEQEREQAEENPLLDNPPDIEVKETEIVLSSDDGEVKMRLFSGKAVGKEGVISLPEAEIEFFLEDTRKLYILAKDLQYTVKENTAVVKGTLTGEIQSMGMRFSAEGVAWDKSTATLTLLAATLVDPSFQAAAKDIRVDVRKDTLEVLGGIRVEL